VHSVFTAYDSGYRQIHKGSEGGGDEGNIYFICESNLPLIRLYSVFNFEPWVTLC